MNRVLVTWPIIVLSLFLVACADGRSANDYVTSAGELVRTGDGDKALEVLRLGIYRFPEDYELNLAMARTLLDYYTDLTPHARSRYLARYYLKRAASLAPDSRRAAAAMAEYERIRDTQR